MPVHCDLTLTVYNVLGQRVEVLVDGNHLPGLYSVQFRGSHLSSGLYFYQLSSSDTIINRKMILVK
ncbi:T9SS type A sorting domain-containing protein [bacterium]|nr:T9SS type A sorting domain-containing protein [bacterium]